MNTIIFNGKTLLCKTTNHKTSDGRTRVITDWSWTWQDTLGHLFQRLKISDWTSSDHGFQFLRLKYCLNGGQRLAHIHCFFFFFLVQRSENQVTCLDINQITFYLLLCSEVGRVNVVDRIEEGRSIRALLPRECKKTSNLEPEDTPSEKPLKKPMEKKPPKREARKKPSDYQSAVSRHLTKRKGCAMVYSDNFFLRCACLPLKSSLEVIEDLYIKALAPNLCGQKSSIATVQLFRYRVPLIPRQM